MVVLDFTPEKCALRSGRDTTLGVGIERPHRSLEFLDGCLIALLRLEKNITHFHDPGFLKLIPTDFQFFSYCFRIRYKQTTLTYIDSQKGPAGA